MRVCANERRVCVDDPLLARLLACCATIIYYLPFRPVCRWKRVSSPSSAVCPLSRPAAKNTIPSFISTDRLLPTLSTTRHTRIRIQDQKEITITIMPGSKFVEILDVSATPYSLANVDLQATIDESRRRSASSGSISSSNESVQSPTSPTSPTAQPMKMRLRALSLRRPKKT